MQVDPKHSNITGLILAGGAGRRVESNDKGLLEFEQEKLIERQIRWLQPQVSEIVISANRNLDIYNRYGHLVVTDSQNKQTSEHHFEGPLKGILQGLIHSKTPYVYVHPVDLPFLPTDTIQQLLSNIIKQQTQQECFLKTNQREHYLSLLINKNRQPELKQFLSQGKRRVSEFLQQASIRGLDIGIPEKVFANLNTFFEFESN
jgi:molybdenum cofactor guanylyltransferase